MKKRTEAVDIIIPVWTENEKKSGKKVRMTA